MKNLFLAVALLFSIAAASQENKGKSGVSVVSTKTQNVLGTSIGYYVEFKNESDKEVDGIKWIATFTNNFGDALGKREGNWQSGNIIPNIKPGETTVDLEGKFVKGATKVSVKITQVHFKQ
jgi:hypothetical protein